MSEDADDVDYLDDDNMSTEDENAEVTLGKITIRNEAKRNQDLYVGLATRFPCLNC